jgi:hypothetical protein
MGLEMVRAPADSNATSFCAATNQVSMQEVTQCTELLAPPCIPRDFSGYYDPNTTPKEEIHPSLALPKDTFHNFLLLAFTAACTHRTKYTILIPKLQRCSQLPYSTTVKYDNLIKIADCAQAMRYHYEATAWKPLANAALYERVRCRIDSRSSLIENNDFRTQHNSTCDT